MLYKEYGNTGKKVSAIGMGGMRFKKEDYLDGDYEKCAEIVKCAYQNGVNYFDTAPGYCDDKSELILGAAFRQMKGTFYVSTKCGLWNAKTADDARRMLEQFLKRLNVERITFYHMWNMKTMDDYYEYMKKGGIYEGAKKAQEEGLIEHLCFSTHMPGEDIATVAQSGAFDGVTLGYNALNFAYRQKGVDACHACGMGVVTMNPLGGGIIPQHPEYFSFINQSSGDSLAVAALKFIVAQKEITVALNGTASVQEMKEGVLAAENVRPSTKRDLDEMKKNLTGKLNELCTGCGYCNECPVGVPIPRLMDGYNDYILSGRKESIESRMRNHWGLGIQSAADCIKCGKCEKLCTQKLPIIRRLGEISDLLNP